MQSGLNGVCIYVAQQIATMGAFKLTKQLACSPSDRVWLVLTYKSNQSH